MSSDVSFTRDVDQCSKADYASTLGGLGKCGLEYNQFMVCGSLFECPEKYTPIKPIGKGAYGVVCSARSMDTNEKVAVKKIANAFENGIDAKRTLREIKLLRHFQHENIVQIRDVMPPASKHSFTDVYVVYELMDTDLHQIIKSSQRLSEEHCQYFIYQVLRGLKYLHSANVLHRDLKPSNVLVNANCDLKICDFGLARTSAESVFMTEYVVTRWYRPPELLLSCTEYTSAIDVWSVGCILAELLGRKPIFPGKDYIHQLSLITKVLGTPTEDQVSFVTSEKARRYVLSLPRHPQKDLHQLWPNASQHGIDLVKRMLVFDPAQRITVDEALRHPYLASLHDPADEPICNATFEFDMDSKELTADIVKNLIYQEALLYYPQLMR